MKRRLARSFHHVIYRQYSVLVVAVVAVIFAETHVIRLAWWLQFLIWLGTWMAADAVQWLLDRADRRLPGDAKLRVLYSPPRSPTGTDGAIT